jgi:hypothetical protein
MTEEQLKYTNVWMALFNHDYDAMAHQLYVKKMAGTYHIDGFSSDEADEIWSYIDGIIQENT